MEMMKAAAAVLALLCGCVMPALASKAVWEEYDKLINKTSTVTAHGTTLFGDQVNLQSGALSFRVTDVTLPGNNTLPVEITRTFHTETVAGYAPGSIPDNNVLDSPLGDWDLELPSISGVFALSTGWVNPAAGKELQRCTAASTAEIGSPTISINGVSFQGQEIWHGTRITLPGRGSQALLLRTGSRPQPTAGGAYWITSDWTSVACLPTIKNGPGQGFVATTPEGTRYWFDWLARADETELTKTRTSGDWGSYYTHLERGRYGLYATRVEDRFGNTVTYTYGNAADAPIKPLKIESNDGRVITLNYSGAFVSSIVAHGKTWRYAYTANRLTTVTLPDTSAWSINLDGFKRLMIRYYQSEPSVQWRACGDPGELYVQSYTGTITHPSGAVGQFTLGPFRQYRQGMPSDNCSTGHPANLNDDSETYPSAWDVYALMKKVLSGPGLSPATWTYSYGGGAVAEVSGPGAYERYVFGNTFRSDEGKLLSVEVGNGPTSILSKTRYSYSLATSGAPYLTPLGDSGQWRSDNFTEEYPRPMTARIVTRDNTDFIWIVEKSCVTAGAYCFDQFARPTEVVKASMPAGTSEMVPPTGAPTLSVPATSNTGSYSASWTAVEYAARYELQERLGTGAWSTIHNAAGTAKAVSGRSNGNWSYQVRACNAAGCAVWSAVRSVAVAIPPSAAPVVTAPASSTTGNFTVTWTAVPTATRYELDERKDSGAWVNIYSGSGTSQARSLESGAYQYRARACNAGGCSGYSAIVATTVTRQNPQPPPAPSGLYAPSSVEKSQTFTVSWYGVSGATSYNLQCRRDEQGWSSAYSGTATSVSQTLSLVGVYQYQVQACNAYGCGAYSSPVTVVVGGNNVVPEDQDE